MLIYKFKIINDEIDNFYREIEIKPGHTFKDFHDIMVDCIKLTPGEMASFYICDSRWNKLQEVSLLDMNEGDDSEKDPESNAKPVKLMSDVKLKESIIDPHQRMIYVYDFLKMHTFYIELSKITDGDEKNQYPRCTKSVSDIIRPKKIQPKPDEIIDKEEEIIDETDEFFGEDDNPTDEGGMDMSDSFDDNKYI